MLGYQLPPEKLRFFYIVLQFYLNIWRDVCMMFWFAAGGKLGSLSSVTEHPDDVVCTEGYARGASAVRFGTGSSGFDWCDCLQEAPLPVTSLRHGSLFTLPHPVGAIR